MLKRDKNILIRLQKVNDAIPFSASGTATSTGIGAIMFEQDMRALRPYIRKILEGWFYKVMNSMKKALTSKIQKSC
jgi:hypothetical protein